MNASLFGKEPADVQETAIIVEAGGETAKVQMNTQAACDSCGAAAVCHPSLGEKPLVEITNDIGARVGDVVLLETDSGSRIIASLLMFGLPILFIILGALWGNQVSEGADGMVAGAVAGLAFSFLILRWISKHLKNKVRFKPRAVRILPVA